MTTITDLKAALVGFLLKELQTPREDGVPGNVLSTAAKVVKDFSHEITDPEEANLLAAKNQKLAAFLSKHPATTGIN